MTNDANVSTTQLTQQEREQRMIEETKQEKPNFAEGMAQLMGMATPAQVVAEAAAQRAIVDSPMPASEGISMISIRDIRESPTNPRKHLGNIDDLIASVKKLGVLQALLGRRLAGGKIELVFGHRRYRAAKAAGLDEVPIDIRTLTDNEVLEAQAVENLQREDLHELEEAEHYGRMKAAGYTAETIAARIGKSPGWVHGRVKLLALGPEARTAVFEKLIPGSVATAIARIPLHDAQARCVQTMLRNATWNVRQMLEFVQKDFCRNLRGSPFDIKDETLVPEAGACKVCPKNSNNQPVTLFSDFEGGIEKQGVCLDTVCFNGKCKAQYQRIAEKAKAAGAEVLSASETKKILNPDGKLTYGVPFVKADDQIHGDPKKRTWGQLFERLEGEERPQLVVAPDDLAPGKAVQLFDRKAAMKAARDMGCKWAQSPAATKTPEEKRATQHHREKERAAATKGAAVLKVTKLTIPRLVERWRTKAGLPELRVAAAEIFSKTAPIMEDEDLEAAYSGFDVPGPRKGKGGVIPTENAIELWLEKHATQHDLIAFILVLVCFEKWTDVEDEFEDTFADLARASGANLKDAVRLEQENMSLEAEKRRGKK